MGVDRFSIWFEANRDGLLTGIAAYRERLGQLVRRVADQMLKQENVPQLVAVSKRNVNGSAAVDKCSG